MKLVDGKGCTIWTDFGEEKKDLGEYYKKFGDPKLKADIAYRILQKK